jgi:hypothetical protein
MGAISAAGCALASLALAALSWASVPGAAVPLPAMVPLGFGLGMTLPALIVAAQGAVGPAMVGVVTALVSFFRSFGGVIGIAVLTSLVMAAADGGSLAEARPDALAHAFRVAFGIAAGVSATAALVALRIRRVSRAGSAASGGARS